MNQKKLLDNFSSHLRNAMALAISHSARLHNSEVTPLHLLYGLLNEKGSVAKEILKGTGITKEIVLDMILDYSEHHQDASETLALPPLSIEAKQAVEKALLFAFNHTHNYVGTEHLLGGILSIKNKSIEQLFKRSSSVTINELLEILQNTLEQISKFPQMQEIASVAEQITDSELDDFDEHELAPPPQQQKPKSILEQFGQELTTEKATTLDPVIGRSEELQRIMTILGRRTKNNPILVGDAGVGKTAIVEGLAKNIVEGKVPPSLKHKRIISIDMAALVAGTMYRGEFESRVRQLLDEVKKQPNIIVFIDEVHNLIGAGSNQGTMDASNLLKPALARGELRCIGATTFDEYKKHITGDPALERRFQTVLVKEPSKKETIQILFGMKDIYERYHGTDISEEAITTAVELSGAYIPQQQFPDKAIDLLDESCAFVTTSRKEIKEKRLKETIVSNIKQLKQQIRQAIDDEQLEKSVALKKKLDKLQIKKKDAIKAEKKAFLAQKTPVTKETIIQVLAKRLQVPKEVLNQSEWEKISTIDSALSTRVLGQDSVIQDIKKVLLTSQIQRKNSKGPRASFFFFGPSGSGKSFLATSLASSLFLSEHAYLKLDMGEFSQSQSTSKLLGSPAGYVGYKDRNRFADHMKEYPHSVVVFDNIDKAHKDVLHILAQILEEGSLRDGSGEHIDFSHAIIIATATAPEELFQAKAFGFNTEQDSQIERQKQDIQKKARHILGETIASHIGGIELFAPLSKKVKTQLIDSHIKNMLSSMKEETGISVTVKKKDLESYIATAKDTHVRPLLQNIERTIYDIVLSEALSNKETKSVTIKAKDNTLILA